MVALSYDPLADMEPPLKNQPGKIAIISRSRLVLSTKAASFYVCGRLRCGLRSRIARG